MKESRRKHWIGLAILAGILVLTLAPAGGERPAWFEICVICGERGTADAILNVMLFMPLGVALARQSWRPSLSVLMGFLLSGTIELIQTVIPGRYPSLADLAMNTIGTGLGVLISAHIGKLVLPSRQLSNILVVGWAALGSLILISTGLLARPSYPDSVYYGQWTPDLGHLGHYEGRVLEFRIGERAVSGGSRLADSDGIRMALLRPSVVRVRAIAGPPAERLSSLVSIYDDRHREIVLLGPDRADLVYRYRTLAAVLRLDVPSFRFRGALAGVSLGDTVVVEVQPGERSLCMAVAGANKCGLGMTIGSGWGFLYSLDGLPRILVLLINASWLCAIMFPGAYWARSAPVSLGYALALGMGIVLVPGAVGLESTAPLEFVGAGIGWVLGLLVGRNARRGKSTSRSFP